MAKDIINTDSIFHEWINKHEDVNWKDALEVRKVFIEWGDYVKDKYLQYLLTEKKIKVK